MKFLVPALLSATSVLANADEVYQKHFDKPTYCNTNTVTSGIEAFQPMAKTYFSEFERGVYHSEEAIIGDECFGHWLVEDSAKL